MGSKSWHCRRSRLDILATLIDAYEAKIYPMDLTDPVEAIRFLMEQQGLTRKDLEPMIGPRNRVADVLNRKRSLSIDMIRKLHARLGISARVLIKPSRWQGRLSGFRFANGFFSAWTNTSVTLTDV